MICTALCNYSGIFVKRAISSCDNLDYLRDFVTRCGTLRLRIARSRKRGFLPELIGKFQRQAEEVCLLIREAFLRGISTPVEDEWGYLFLDGVSLRVRPPSGRQRVQMLVAYGVRRDGTRQNCSTVRTLGRFNRFGQSFPRTREMGFV
jgi:transposase-like protein